MCRVGCLQVYCTASRQSPRDSIPNIALRRDHPTCEQHQDLLCGGTALVSGSGPGCFPTDGQSYNLVATQSYSRILFPIEVHLVLFCKYLKRREFARSFYRPTTSVLQQTFVLDVLKQNAQSQLYSWGRGSGLSDSTGKDAADLWYSQLQL